MKQTEIGLIPDDWEVKTLIEIGYFIGGGTPNTNIPSYWKGTIPWVSSSDIKKDSITSLIPTRFITQEAINNSATKLCSPDTLLIVSRVGVGKLAIAEEEVCTSQDFSNFVCTKQNVKFIAYELLQKMQKKAEEAQGTSIKGITTEEIKLLKIPLPPLAEQHRIAKALSDVDAVISTTEKLIQKKKNIKQGAMQNLLTGKKRLPGFAAASKLKQTELGEIPEDWEVKKIKNFAKVFDGTHQTPHYVDVGIPFYSVENVTANDFEHTKLISEEEHRVLTSKVKIEKGDILMTRIGSIGDCKYVDWESNASFYVSLALIKCDKSVDAKFVSYYSNSLQFKKELELRSLITAIPQKINLGPISEIVLFMPSKEEQTAIANVLSSMDKEIESLNTKLEKYRNLKTAMMQQLLTGKIRLVK